MESEEGAIRNRSDGNRAATPIVHIGFHKTGSSWLQKRVFPLARGVSVVPRTEIRRELLVPSPLAFDPERARAALSRGREGRLVVSDEELSGNLHSAGLHGAFSELLVDRLYRTFPDGHVVVFVREQKTMLASAYKQYLKSGGTRRIRGFLKPSKAPHKRPGFSLDHLAYDRLIGLYEQRFGRERVSVFLYEELAEEPKALVARMRERLALDVDPGAVSASTVNAGYRSGTLAVLRFLNLFHDRELANSTCLVNLPGLYPLLGVLAPWLDRLPFMGRVQELSDLLRADEIAAIEDRFRESNARLDQAHELGLARFGYALP